MDKPQHARDLAKFLAPALRNASGINAEPDSPGSCSCHEEVAGPAEPAVDFAIYLELREAWRKGNPKGNGAAEQDPGRLSERLAELLERDDHAVGVLGALMAGRGDHPRADAPQQPLAGPPGGQREPGGRRPSGGGSRSCLPPKTSSGLRRAWAGICMNAIVVLVLLLAWWLAWPPLQVRPQAGVLSLEVFAVWSLSFLPGWLYIRFLGQRAGALWDEYVLNLHRLRWDSPRHLPKPPVNSEFYAEWLGDGGALLARQPNIYQQKFDAYYGKSVSRSGQRDGPRSRSRPCSPSSSPPRRSRFAGRLCSGARASPATPPASGTC